MDLIRFDRTDHHPVTFAFVADRNFPDSDFHRAVCNDRQTSTSVFGRNAQIAAIYRQGGELTKIDFKPTTRKVQNDGIAGIRGPSRFFLSTVSNETLLIGTSSPLMGFKNLGGHPDRFLVRSAWRKKAPFGAFLHFTLLAQESPLLLANFCRRGLYFQLHSCAIQSSSISCD
jgi:phage gpG-like protein